eukprot:4022275-Alexandrium_andersonii.AAC.1
MKASQAYPSGFADAIQQTIAKNINIIKARQDALRLRAEEQVISMTDLLRATAPFGSDACTLSDL